MKLLITGADRALGQTAARHFSRQHDVRCVGRDQASPSLAGIAYAQSDLRDPAAASSLLQGVKAVLYLEAYHAGETRPERATHCPSVSGELNIRTRLESVPSSKSPPLTM